MEYIYREAIITLVAYIGSVLCILAINKKNNKSISSIKYILSVIIAPASVLVERVIINTLDIVCDLLISSKIDAINMSMVNTIYGVAPIFISFITIIIIFKLIAKCRISKKIWIVLLICTIISIGTSIMQGIYSADMLSDKLSALSSDSNFLSFFVDTTTTKLNVISDVYMINRCLLVILSTWSMAKQISNKEDKKNE
ncbi:MAG: hypothetical protein NC393_01330 [Clostridium sp.]|nr:hypothetical protein [Clostridium sp.]MCM1170745.1 hypothetical protein [Clostridium sp.]MCM1207618.1 hypothetical protein [Ruminococcus sp.]